MSKPLLIAITGPTASGKSVLAVDLALRLGTEIISADSRQVYRGMPVITAVPTEDERRGVRHHLLEELDPEEYFSASMFEQEALERLRNIFSRKPVAIACGGSMMYVDALCEGIDDIPTVPDDIRSVVASEYPSLGIAPLLDELSEKDPECFSRIDKANHKRVMHAVEICRTAGIPYSSLLGKPKPERPFRLLKFRLDMPRDVLFNRINRRVEEMIRHGALEEAAQLYPKRHLNSLNTVGLKELFRFIGGEWDLATAVARIQKNTRVYAKKQVTWYKRSDAVIPVDALSSPLETILSAAASLL